MNINEHNKESEGSANINKQYSKLFKMGGAYTPYKIGVSQQILICENYKTMSLLGIPDFGQFGQRKTKNLSRNF